MPTKTLSQKNGNGSHSETLSENPSQLKGTIEQAQAYSAADTEIENVEGYTRLKLGEGDKEVSNIEIKAGGENESQVALEEAGADLLEDEGVLLDAFFASYPDLIPKIQEEVIIGTDDRIRITNTTVFPWRAICGLKITAGDGTRWIGTGWMISPRTVMTAGHCVHIRDHGGWVRSIEVIPGLNDTLRPYGSSVGTIFRSTTGWVNSQNRDYDYGCIILPNTTAGRLGDRTGYFGFSVKDNAFLMASVLNLSGYPGDKGGNQQWFMSLAPKSVSSRVITYNIDTMGGQSGAPVWILVSGNRYGVGIHTNGSLAGNSATRIVTDVFNNMIAWKNLGL